MLRNPIRLLALVLLCGIAPATARAGEPEKTGEKKDSPLPARTVVPKGTVPFLLTQKSGKSPAEPLKTGKNRDTLLYVRTDPPGATVFLNGKKLGTTSGLFPVEPGSGTILLELEGHQAGQRPVIVRANGITRVELDLAPQDRSGLTAPGANWSPPPSNFSPPPTPTAKNLKFITSKSFRNGDDITIQEIWSERGTLAKDDTVTVRGTYTLSSQPAAKMLFSITTKDVSQDKAFLTRQVRAGTAVPFEMTRPITCDGDLHIGFYSVEDGSALGNVYFTKAPQATAASRKVKFFLGPKAFREGDKIEIQEVLSHDGTLFKGDTVKVKGTYTLRSQPAANLSFFIDRRSLS